MSAGSGHTMSRKIRVCLIGHTYVAGINEEKLDALAAIEGVELQVIVPTEWREGDLNRVLRPAQRTDRSFGLVAIPPLVQRGGTLFLLRPLQLWNTLRRFDPDVIHLEQVPYTLIASQVSAYSRLLRTPLIVFTWESIDRPYPLPFSALNRFVLRTCRQAIAGNRDAAAVLRTKGYPGPIDVLPQLGVNTARFRRSEAGATAREAFVVGYVGRLVEEKGLDDLLQAVAYLGDPGVRLILIGEGPNRSQLEESARALGIDDRIEWIPAVCHEDVPAVFGRMDVLVLPSRTTPNWMEQFGHVLIEAMAMEVPVIGSDSGEIPNVIADAGMVFHEGGTHELAHCIEQLRDDPDLCRRLGTAGLERVRANYTHERIAARTVEIYHSVRAQWLSRGSATR